MSTKPNLPQNAGPVDWAGPDSYFYGISGLIHCVRVPAAAGGANLAPAVVMVHGWGGDESVMWIFKSVVPAHAAIITPRAPVDLAEGGHIWFEREGVGDPVGESQRQAIRKFEHFLSSLPDLYPIDPARILLIGFSQGGAMCNTLALTDPERVIGVASLASFIPKLPAEVKPVTDLKGLPVFIAHGTDDDVIPVDEARKTRERYEGLGAEVTYGEYPVRHKMHSRGIEALGDWVKGLVNSDE